MSLTLSITNLEQLENGESIRLVLDRHGAVIGRSPHADWSLPDPRNYISSTHCEVEYREGAYWLVEPAPGSEAAFVTEHYWGYNAQTDGSTLEYRVEHPRWRVYEVGDAKLDCDAAGLYGEQFCDSLNRKPSSAFLAEGSAVTLTMFPSSAGRSTGICKSACANDFPWVSLRNDRLAPPARAS